MHQMDLAYDTLTSYETVKSKKAMPQKRTARTTQEVEPIYNGCEPSRVSGLRGSLSYEAYRTIRHRILTGELALGSALSRRTLAREFGMSFSPISEALQSLEADGLVESRPRVGTVVRIPSPRYVREHCIVRQALEAQAARLFAEKASTDERQELLGMAAKLDSMFEKQGRRKVFDRNAWWSIHDFHLQLHVRIVECTGVQLLCDAIHKTHTLIFNWMFNTASDFRSLPPRFHQDLIDVLLRGDPIESEEAMRRHTQHSEREIVRRMKLYTSRLSARLIETAPRNGDQRH